ncbi:beta-aspartyl-peptidase [Clostridium estertheticum]|uniref:beta-aspartyl-peptidase n=1 Tax=Clostridium estertheticum TaxID=238834 RepID=UPI0013EE72C7|nr:beta-aspartyl-peptidase [Clostridium estertheticum]MBZ9606836.1 beta-aspartyl-peptidase [Clostridium estertheticum]
MLTLIKGGKVYSPQYMGKKDILICGDKIELIEDSINIENSGLEIKVIEAYGKVVFPGFIDSHVHILGGGGEGGFKTRTPEINLSDLTTAGVTTVIGCLGTDGISRDVKSLLAKARALEEEGVSTFIYTGSYKIPIKSITGNVQEDIILIDKIIGVGEVALSDHRSSNPTFEQFSQLAGDARVAGMLSGKAGVINVHMGDGKNELNYLDRLAEETDIPLTQIIPTHINRNPSLFKKGLEYAKNGGYVDLTTSTTKKFLEEGELKCSTGLRIMLEGCVNIKNITFTSDGQGSLPDFDDKGECIGLKIGRCDSLYKEVRDAIMNENVSIENAISVITSNPAEHLKLKTKGYLKVGFDADIIVVNEDDLNINTVVAKGITMIHKNKVLVKGIFEK